MTKRTKIPDFRQRRLADFPERVSLPARFVKGQAVCLTRDKTTSIVSSVANNNGVSYLKDFYVIMPANAVGTYIRTEDRLVVYGRECVQHLIRFDTDELKGWLYCDDDELSPSVEMGQTDGS